MPPPCRKPPILSRRSCSASKCRTRWRCCDWTTFTSTRSKCKTSRRSLEITSVVRSVVSLGREARRDTPSRTRLERESSLPTRRCTSWAPSATSRLLATLSAL
ncbi:unnamed protein product [Ectocarpus sp. 13 AM-2016]